MKNFALSNVYLMDVVYATHVHELNPTEIAKLYNVPRHRVTNSLNRLEKQCRKRLYPRHHTPNVDEKLLEYISHIDRDALLKVLRYGDKENTDDIPWETNEEWEL